MTFSPFDTLSPEKAGNVILVLQIIEGLSKERAYERYALKKLNLLIQQHKVADDLIVFAAIIRTHMARRDEVEATLGFDDMLVSNQVKLWSAMFAEADLIGIVADKEELGLTSDAVVVLQERFRVAFRKLSSNKLMRKVEQLGSERSHDRKVWYADIFRIPSL
jgi:hypothetical protein